MFLIAPRLRMYEIVERLRRVAHRRLGCGETLDPAAPANEIAEFAADCSRRRTSSDLPARSAASTLALIVIALATFALAGVAERDRSRVASAGAVLRRRGSSLCEPVPTALSFSAVEQKPELRVGVRRRCVFTRVNWIWTYCRYRSDCMRRFASTGPKLPGDPPKNEFRLDRSELPMSRGVTEF